jgi:cellulose synthase/poly-beta-1,6-N-acetylglucosamine synthase-like glycosyltransferase
VSATVVIATYMRTDRLRACLDGVRAQTRPPDEVVVLTSRRDQDSRRVIEALANDWPQLRFEIADRPGTVEAYNLGLEAARSDVVAYVDDDAVPAPDWLEQIERTFESDGRIAAVGGRDIVEMNGQVLDVARRRHQRRSSSTLEVGRIQWFGRMIANHHAGTGGPRDVDVLKGANMSFRRSAAIGHGFDCRLRGGGAVVHSELSICLPLRRLGRRVVYDPGIIVHHYPAPRLEGAGRGDLSRAAVFAESHNEALAILDYFGPLRRVVFTTWGLVIGVTASPGIAVLVRDLLTGRPAAVQRFRAAQRGRFSAWGSRRLPRHTA